jgi:hypothetical protein
MWRTVGRGIVVDCTKLSGCVECGEDRDFISQPTREKNTNTNISPSPQTHNVTIIPAFGADITFRGINSYVTVSRIPPVQSTLPKCRV